MQVSEAVQRRKSVRHFTDQPVDDKTIRRLLELASRAPSGGNVQPWRGYVVNGATMREFRSFIATCEPGREEYPVYPPKLWEPYRSNRFELGEMMYATIGIERIDRDGRLAQFAKNKDFFGAPAALFCFVDRGMGPPQWSDLGMFLQTFMLLSVEAGLATCPQEFWTSLHEPVHEFCAAPDDEMLFCGIAIGYEDTEHPINTLVSKRMPLDDWCAFV